MAAHISSINTRPARMTRGERRVLCRYQTLAPLLGGVALGSINRHQLKRAITMNVSQGPVFPVVMLPDVGYIKEAQI